MIVPAPTLSRYLEHLEQFVIPRYEAAPGLISVLLLQRPFVAYAELVTLSMWQSDEDMTRFLESQAMPVFPEEGVIQIEPHAFEIVLSRQGRSPDAGGRKPDKSDRA